jgi:hypothetical protein
MRGLLKRPGYRLLAPDSPEAEGTAVRTILGINEDGVFGTSRAGWHADLPDACHEPFIPLLWLKIHELLGRVPEGSTARFLEDGTLPD